MELDFIQTVLLQLFVLILVARVTAFACERVKIPAVIGEIFAGILIGNTVLFSLLKLGSNMEVFQVFKELGVVFLLFAVGLETPFSDLRRVGSTAMMVAILGVVFPLVGGYLLMSALGYAHIETIFVATALVATSVGITARVIKDMNLVHAVESRVIIGAAVIDDILGMIILAGAIGVSVGGPSGLADALIVALEGILFVLLVIIVGGMLIPKARQIRDLRKVPSAVTNGRLGGRNDVVGVALIVCLGLSFVASYLGLAAIIGAFLAGMMFAEFRDNWPCEQKFEPINRFFVPFFFLFVGISVDLSSFGGVLWAAVLVTLLAMVTKIVGCGLGARKLGARSAAIVGVGMMPRGEVGIIVASIGLTVASVSSSTFATIVFMAIATTLAAPPLLTWTFKRKERIRNDDGVKES